VYGALGRGRPRFTPRCTCGVLLKFNHSYQDYAFTYGTLTRFGAMFQYASVGVTCYACGRPPQEVVTYNPRAATPVCLARHEFRQAPGSLATTTGVILVPPGTEMFQFPRCPPSQRTVLVK
jgi:hypothetical protein